MLSLLSCRPATPDKQEHAEHLNRWLPAVESGKVSQMLPGIALDFWSIRIPETGTFLRVWPLQKSCGVHNL